MDLLLSIPIVLTTIVGGFSALWGIYVYRDGQKLKRKDALFPVVEELHKSKALINAQAILDDRVIRCETKWNKSVDAYDIIWDEIHGDYRPLKNLLKKGSGLDWIEKQDFIKNEDENIVMIQDEDHFLSIIRNEKLPYRVDVKTLDKMIGIQDNKHRYRYVYYFYADIVDKKVNQLGHYFHRSGLKYILRKHSSDPIMDNDEDQIRESFDSFFRFWEGIWYLDEGLGLFGNKEINFFLEHMKKLLDDDAIKEYVEYYKFRLELS